MSTLELIEMARDILNNLRTLALEDHLSDTDIGYILTHSEKVAVFLKECAVMES